MQGNKGTINLVGTDEANILSFIAGLYLNGQNLNAGVPECLADCLAGF
jgi:hypothetical protein